MSNLSCISNIACLWYSMSMRLCSLGAPLPGFIYATGLRFYKSSSWIQIRVFLLLLQVIFESLFWSISIMGRTRYTNLRVPEGHSLVSSPRDSIRVADSGWVSKLQSLTSFNLRFLQFFYFFNFRLQFFDFLKSSGSWIRSPDWSEMSSLFSGACHQQWTRIFFLALHWWSFSK
jgi:hypothetical protein